MKTLHPVCRRRHGIVPAAAALLALLACAGAGGSSWAADELAVETRETPPGGTLSGKWAEHASDPTSQPVTFSFHREKFGEGRISVRLGAAGKRYVGQYLRITGNGPLAPLRVYYNSWVSDAFDDFLLGPAGAPLNRHAITIEEFRRRYSGSVVATLVGEGGGSMRCVFALRDAQGGLAAGAGGTCQVSDGGVIDLVEGAKG